MSVDHELFADALPTYLTRFVGRRREMGELAARLEGARLVTVCGVGGAGKTRLAIEVAKRWRATHPGVDVHWIPLATITDPDAVPRSVAAALGLDAGSGLDPLTGAIDVLRDRPVVLVLDNCEQVAGACREMVPLLSGACRGLTVLATSREPLGGPIEQVFPIPPLGTAGDSAAHGQPGGEAAELFVDRAITAAPVYALTGSNAATVRNICARLDGLPLAIELAASWIRVLSAEDLLAEIDKSMEVLTTQSPLVAGRHRSLHAVLASSWQWLGENERRVLSALGVFVGGFTREAAQAVSGASLASLAALVERSLIQRLPDATGGTRYQVHELVRAYALERLAGEGSTAVADVRSRHFDVFLTIVERADAVWEASDGPRGLRLVRDDQANIDAAMRWALERQDTDRALRMAAGLFSFWIFTSVPTQYSTTLDRALNLPARPEDATALRVRAGALVVAGHAAIATGDLVLARSRFNDGLALAERLEDPVLIGTALRGLAHALLICGELGPTRDHIERSLSISRSVDDRRGIAWSIHDLAELELANGRLERSEMLLEQAMHQFSELGNVIGTYRSEVLLGTIYAAREDWSTALSAFGRALTSASTMHIGPRVAVLFEGVAQIAAALRAPELATQLLGSAESWRRAHGFPRQQHFAASYQRVLSHTRRQLTDQAWQDHHAAGAGWTSVEALQHAASCVVELGSTLERRAVGLTEREMSVLRLLAPGLSNDAIAARLAISPRTVHAHLRSIFDKLGVSTRTAAVHEATRLDLV
ncbi:MAG TPA: LuxR C-terminal-related transcriptional regulator [Microlunatus sp.]|nr:LuxR C-terminal-related transcriptional regulator [Microlunatus sp.]